MACLGQRLRPGCAPLPCRCARGCDRRRVAEQPQDHLAGCVRARQTWAAARCQAAQQCGARGGHCRPLSAPSRRSASCGLVPSPARPSMARATGRPGRYSCPPAPGRGRPAASSAPKTGGAGAATRRACPRGARRARAADRVDDRGVGRRYAVCVRGAGECKARHPRTLDGRPLRLPRWLLRPQPAPPGRATGRRAGRTAWLLAREGPPQHGLKTCYRAPRRTDGVVAPCRAV